MTSHRSNSGKKLWKWELFARYKEAINWNLRHCNNSKMNVKEALFVAVMLTDPIIFVINHWWLWYISRICSNKEKIYIITPTLSFKNHNEDQIFIYPLCLTLWLFMFIEKHTFSQQLIPIKRSRIGIQSVLMFTFGNLTWNLESPAFLRCLTHQMNSLFNCLYIWFFHRAPVRFRHPHNSIQIEV